MKRLLLIIILGFVLAGQARAAQLPQELLDHAPEAAVDVADEGFQQGLSSILNSLRDEAADLFRQGIGGMVGILLVLLLCGIGESLFHAVKGKAANCLTVAGAAAITAVASGDLDHLIGQGVETMTELDQFSKVLLPALAAATASTGMVGTASVRQVATVFFCDLLITIAHNLVLPFLYLYIGAAAAGAMLADRRLDTAANAVKKVMTWLLTGLLTLFTLYLSVSGAVAGTADASAVRMVRRAITSAVPVVGGVMSGVAETLLSGAGVLKNSVGIFGILTVVAICGVPFLRLAIQYLLYKAAAFVAGTVASPPLVKLIESLGTAFGLVLGMVGSCALLLMVSILSYLLVVAI